MPYFSKYYRRILVAFFLVVSENTWGSDDNLEAGIEIVERINVAPVPAINNEAEIEIAQYPLLTKYQTLKTLRRSTLRSMTRLRLGCFPLIHIKT